MKPDPALSLPSSRSRVLTAIRNGATLDDATVIVGSTAKAARDLAAGDGATAEAWQQSLAEACADGEAFLREKAAGEAERVAREAVWAEAQRVSAEAEAMRNGVERSNAKRARPAGRGPGQKVHGWAPVSGEKTPTRETALPTVRPETSIVLPSDSWAKARREAAAIEPGHTGTLLWIDARCQAAGMHALDIWWVDTLRAFYRSGRLVLAARIGLRGGKSVSVCRALVNDALFMLRDLDPGTVGVIPVMSADRTEATDRFFTILAILRACGVSSTKKGEEEDSSPGGIGSTYTSTTLPSGGGVIKTVDSQGHAVEFRIYPARITGAVGYTAVAGFCDEVDLWPVDLGVSADDVAQRSDKGRANPGDVVLARLLERFTTTRATAHLYIVSASYRGEDSAHARKIATGVKNGESDRVMWVARLGVIGAARDDAARSRLSTLIASDDPRLLSSADPLSPNVAAWVTSPVAKIEDCYDLSGQHLGAMFGRYGGRPDDASGGGSFADVEMPVDETRPSPVDTVIGVAPPVGNNMWGRVVVGIASSGVMHIIDDASGSEAFDPARYAYALAVQHTSSVLAVAAPHEGMLSAWLGAAYMGGVMVAAPVAGIDVHDGPTLRTGPLRTAYQRGRLTHAPGLAALEGDLHRFTGDVRSPRVEALAVAVARLVACYPHLGAQDDAEPIRGQRVPEMMMGEGRGDGNEMLRRLGARP